MSASRRRGRHDNWRQDLVELVAPHLEPGRQAERGAELFGWLVDGEARAVGRDLEQDATRFAEIDRLEVPAVDDRRHVAAGTHEQVAPAHLGLRVGRPPSDVVHRADALLAYRAFR